MKTMSRKFAIAVCTFVLMLAWIAIPNTNRTIEAHANSIVVPDQYSTIQTAINHADDGDTIFVKSGTYYEHVVVNRTVALVGENKDTTIIDGSYVGVVVNVTRDGVGISGFTIRRSGATWNIGGPPYGAGIYMRNVIDCSISGNKLTQDAAGIQLEYGADGNVITNNTMTDVGLGFGTLDASWNSFTGNNVTSNDRGLGVNVNSDYNIISDNRVTAPEWVIALHACHYNNITRNYIANGQIGIYLPDSSDNRVYHNQIVSNTQQASLQGFPSHLNYWDNGCEGNYWSDYVGTDSDGDGVGDTSYIVDSNNVDHCPLVNPYWNAADINHDLKVDLKDVYTTAKAYGSYLGHPAWNPHCDINEDSTVDLKDYYTVCKNYGKTYLPRCQRLMRGAL